MAKKKLDKLSEIVGDAYGERFNKLSVLAAALDLVTEGTRYRQDAIEIIKGCYPDYFKDEAGRVDTLYERKENNL